MFQKCCFSFSACMRMLLLSGLFFVVGCTENTNPTQFQTPTGQFDDCYVCAAYTTIFDGISATVNRFYDPACSYALLALGVGLLFWLGFTVLKLVGSVKEPNIKDEIQKITAVLFKALLVGAALSSSEALKELVSFIVDNVIMFFLELSWEILGGVQRSAPADFAYLSDNLPKEVLESELSKSEGVLGGYVYVATQKIVFQIYKAFSEGLSLGWTIMTDPFVSFNVVVGLAVIVAFLALMLMMPLMFIDAFVLIGVVILLAPFLFAAWVFPSTKSWISYGWNTLISAMITLLIACIYTAFFVMVVANYLGTSGMSFSAAVQGNSLTTVRAFKMASVGGVSFFFLVWCLMRMSQSLSRLASALGGVDVGSHALSAFNKLKELGMNVAKVVAGAVLMFATGGALGKGIAMSGAKGAADQMKQELKENATDGGQAPSASQDKAETQFND